MLNKLLVGIFCLALTAFFVGVAVTQAGDGDTPAEESVCEPLMGGTPGLYGLCVAFCEAQDCEPGPNPADPFADCKPASLKILEQYDRKKLPGDPNMPCTEVCCFSQEEVDTLPAAGDCYLDCKYESSGITQIVGTISVFANISESVVPGGTNYCSYQTATGSRSASISDDAAAVCKLFLQHTQDTSGKCPTTLGGEDCTAAN